MYYLLSFTNSYSLTNVLSFVIYRLQRGAIIRLSCGHEYLQCLNSATDKFAEWLADPVNVQ